MTEQELEALKRHEFGLWQDAEAARGTDQEGLRWLRWSVVNDRITRHYAAKLRPDLFSVDNPGTLR